MSTGSAGHEGPLAEFVALRQEVERRNNIQHALFVLQITTAGAVFSFSAASARHGGFLLIIPISSYMLCARYVDQQYGTQRAALYIKDELSGRVPGGLGWESWQLQNYKFVRGSTVRRINALMILFPAPGVAALAWKVASAFGGGLHLDGIQRTGFDVLWLVGLASVGMCCQMIWAVIRHPLGDASVSPVFQLPASVLPVPTTPPRGTD